MYLRIVRVVFYTYKGAVYVSVTIADISLSVFWFELFQSGLAMTMMTHQFGTK